ncbi:extracellular solute-binding protein [Haliovirga abyssi]|uniref:Maltose ABC transporter substrate-binding protein n=1 Tax=Haliovirga abyssi TaxID=2996794 RepID=A0AAU9DZR1_9FUSO|nr:extracellular solute-binding protein [Haliovirga abyssi]BDU51065.1 maltose ABC transporter substrate-binding protein [Haliovirga abyssi]
MKKSLLMLIAMLIVTSLSFSTEIQIWEKWESTIDPTYDKAIAMFEKENPGITVKRVHYAPEDLRYNFQNAAFSGNPPAIVLGPSDTVGVYATMGIIKPISEVKGLDQEFLKKFIPTSLKQLTIFGELYGVPEQIGNHLTLIYNKKYVKKVPTTWKELLATDYGTEYKLVYNLNEPYWFVGFLGAFGGWVMDDNSQPTLDTPAMVKALQFVHDLKYVSKAVPTEADYGTADSLFKDGKAAFIINGDWSYSSYKSVLKDNMGLAKVPQVPGGGFYSPMTAVQGLFVPEGLDPKVEEAAGKFIKFITRKDIQLFTATRDKTLPVNIEAANDPSIKNDPFLAGSVAQMLMGKPMPIVPEMRAIWDAIRPFQEDIMNDKISAKDAAAGMQKLAEKKISDMNQ